MALLAALFSASCGRGDVPLSAPVQRSAELPVIMYHSVLKDPAKTGKYTVTPDTFRDDMLYLGSNGYTTVFISELSAYANGVGALPDKPVLVTLDDGYYNNLVYVLPILEELDMKAVISVVGSYTETFSTTPDPNPNYAHLSFDDITALEASGRVEIQHHSYDMHGLGARRGSSDMAGESAAHYREAFVSDTERLTRLLEDKCGISVTAYTYPYGIVGRGSEDMLRELGFCCTLTCRERMNTLIFGDPECLFGLGRYNRPGHEATADFMRRALSSE